MGILFAFFSLISSSLNDLLFKCFSGEKKSQGLFFSLIGFFATILMTVILFCFPKDLQECITHWHSTLFWGIIVGFFSFVANIFLLEGMKRQTGGICSTIYRLNLVPTVLGAALFLQESISPLHWLGIGSASLAVLCFCRNTEQPKNNDSAHSSILGILLCIIAAILRACMGLTSKRGLPPLGEANAMGVTLLIEIWWLVGGFIYGYIWERPLFKLNRHMIKYGFLSGILVLGICFFMTASLKYGQASVVLPIAQLSFPCTLVLSILFLHEKLTFPKILGMIFSIAAILLLVLP